jgi:hypothetical protein
MARIVKVTTALTLVAATAASLFSLTCYGGNSAESGVNQTNTQESEQVSPAVRKLMDRCNKKDAEACHKVAVAYREKDGVRSSAEMDYVYSLKACDLGLGKACYNVGNNYFYGLWVKEDQTKARIYHEKACSLGDSDGCLSAGYAFLEGREVRVSAEKAIAYFEKAGINGDPGSAASATAEAILRLNVKDRYGDVLPLLEKACSLDSRTGCGILGNFYEKGFLVPSDMRKARGYWRKACDLENKVACKKYNQ